jgi:hypothetical protein
MAETTLESLTAATFDQTHPVIRHMAIVGQIASSWATFEIAIDINTISLARITTTMGFCLTAQVIGPARKLDAYIAVARERGAGRFMDELDKFAKDTAGFAERRNRAVHDPWIVLGQNPARRFEITARRRLKALSVPVTESELSNLMTEINKHRDRFIELHERIVAAVGT